MLSAVLEKTLTLSDLDRGGTIAELAHIARARPADGAAVDGTAAAEDSRQ